MKALTYANFEVSHEFMRSELTNPEKVCAEIAVVGGIMVNLPGNLSDRFVPMTFEVLDCATGELTDMHHAFAMERPELSFGSDKKRSPLLTEAARNIRDQAAAGEQVKLPKKEQSCA